MRRVDGLPIGLVGEDVVARVDFAGARGSASVVLGNKNYCVLKEMIDSLAFSFWSIHG